MKRFLHTLLVFACAFCAQCASPTKAPEFRLENKYAGRTGAAIVSAQKGDFTVSYEIYLSLAQPEKCLDIGISARRSGGEHSYVKETLKVFFIVERAVNVSQFRLRNNPFIFTEIGRNFDLNWESVKSIWVCTSKTDPLKKLDAGVYRLRFSMLSAAEFDFEIRVLSNEGPVSFSAALPVRR